MLEIWKISTDKREVAGALLNDLSKAFDFLNHELLAAKLEAYGFDLKSISLMLSYISGRKHRVRLIMYFSNWFCTEAGVPQGSILGQLLFNIYMNDIFYFVEDRYLVSYADDNNHFAVGNYIGNILSTLKRTTEIMITWYNDNYFRMNSKKCKLLVAKYGKKESIKFDKEVIIGNESTKGTSPNRSDDA